MIFKLFYVLMLTIHSQGYHGPTFRSSIMEGNKPILRMPPESSAEQIENAPEKNIGNEPLWMVELRSSIKQLVAKLGHKSAKPYIKKLVEETEDNNNVLLHVEVSRDGACDIKHKHLMRAMRQYPFATGSVAHPIATQEPDPQWLTDLRVFIKELIGRYGKRRLDEFVTPVIRAIQKQHNVIIKDIDVDEYGEVYINYLKRSPRSSPWTAKRSKKFKKQHENTAESENSDSQDSARVTEMPM